MNREEVQPMYVRPCHGLGGDVSASQRGGPDSLPSQSMWDLWWTKWYWDRFYSEFLGLPCQYHSTVALKTHIIWGRTIYPLMAAA
jgi:hypothetical protein